VTTNHGLRERKKQQTRAQITQAARELFADRGYDQVTLSEVARAADVSDGTLFNYFPRKEDLVFGGMQDHQEQLLRTIRERPVGEPILTAFRRFVLEPADRGLLRADDQPSRQLLARMTRIVADSPALLARESQIFQRYTDALAELIAAETAKTDEDIEPWVAANAMIGVHRALIAYVRRQILAGSDHRHIRRKLRTQAKHALALLEHGLPNSLDLNPTPRTVRR
jgi:AcrR family transcriptional regulator